MAFSQRREPQEWEWREVEHEQRRRRAKVAARRRGRLRLAAAVVIVAALVGSALLAVRGALDGVRRLLTRLVMLHGSTTLNISSQRCAGSI